jgi:hypothetical protein
MATAKKASTKKDSKTPPVIEPFDMQDRFKNLENPLKFIENRSILSLEEDYNRLKTALKREQ